MFLYSKAFRKCDSAETIGEKAEEYVCPKNFKGSSNSMETFVTTTMVDDALYNNFFIIDVIVRYNSSTMLSVIKHTSKGARGQVIKSSRRKVDEETLEPSLFDQ